MPNIKLKSTLSKGLQPVLIMPIVLWIVVPVLFLAANRISYKKPSPYQTLVWEIKANEGYRDWWYRDGSARINGKTKPSHSIGLGWNDYGGTRRHKISEYTRDGKVTYEEALKITLAEINKYGRMHKDPYTDVAMKLYSYNCGEIKYPSQLGKCHGGTDAKNKRCGHSCSMNGTKGHKCSNVRKAHNKRRELELALRNHNWPVILEMNERNRLKVVLQMKSNRGN